MSLPISKGEMKRLGKRLRASDAVLEEDLHKLATVLAVYEEALAKVDADLRTLGFLPTTRPKTTAAIVYKLRHSKIPLHTIQDLVGARIIVDDLQTQDEARERICDFYSSAGIRWRNTDRIADPRAGYRAIHVVVLIDAIPVEIQVRTNLQDRWAQMSEGLAMAWGRGVKYDQDPEDPEREVLLGKERVTRRQVVSLFMQLSDAVHAVEQTRDEEARLQLRVRQQLATLAELRARPSDWHGRLVPADMVPDARQVFAGLRPVARRFRQADRAMIVGGSRGITLGEIVRAIDLSVDELESASRKRALDVQLEEIRLDGILQVVARAAEDAWVGDQI